MLHPSLSPGLSPTNFHLSLGLHDNLKNMTFINEDNWKMEVHNLFESKIKVFRKWHFSVVKRLGERRRMSGFIF